MRTPSLPRHMLVALGILGGLASAQDPRPFTPLDVVRTRNVLDAEISPDGTQVLFRRSKPRWAGDGSGPHYRELWILDLPSAGKRRPSQDVDPGTWPYVRDAASFRLATPRQLDERLERLINLAGRPLRLQPTLGFREVDNPVLGPGSGPGPKRLDRVLDQFVIDLEKFTVDLRDPSRSLADLAWRANDDLIEIGLASEARGAPLGHPRPRPLRTGKVRVSGARFTPDGAFVSILGQADEAPHPEVCLIPVAGGEPLRLTHTPHGVLDYRFGPAGRSIAYVAREPRSPAHQRARAGGFRAEIVEEDLRHRSLHVWDRRTGKSRRLTEGMTVWAMEWSADGRRIAIAAAPDPTVDSRYMRKRLHWIDVQSGRVEAFDPNPGKLGAFRWSPDGERLAYIGALDHRDPHAGTLWITSVGGEARALTPDLRGMVHDLEWIDDDELLVSISRGVLTMLATVDTRTGELERFRSMEGLAAREFSRSEGGRLVAAGSTAELPAEVFELTPKGAKRRTWSNPWLEERQLAHQQVVRFSARDGLAIEGLLMHPSVSVSTPAPLVIVAHGGPEAHYSHGWLTRYSAPGQVLASRGMFVWYPNYRASTGYGVAFAKADHGDPMGGQFRDHLDAIEHFAEAGLIDPERVGIIGGSYGGYTAAWAATKETEHFRAAVSFVPFTDMKTKWWSSDIPVEFFLVHYREMWPHEQRELMRERSPLTYAGQCRTPLLLAGGTADSRVHPAQPHMLWRKVDLLTETPVRYVRYPGEGHGNRLNVFRFDYCKRSVRWLSHYLEHGRNASPPDLPLPVEDWLETQ